ncbi:MAG: DNA primase [Patescibacteria group bacterium]
MSKEIEQIKDRLDIVDLVGSYIKLDKAGKNYKAKCPFHGEKTPSFMVSPERQSFYCFGCQAKGDIFEFVQKFEGLEFKEALKILAERTGVELKQYKQENKDEESKKERLLKVLEEATQIYENLLGCGNQMSTNEEVMKYLEDRGLKEETIKKWRIGWAPLEWRTILNELITKGFKEGALLDAGLVKKTEDKTKTYDVFRGRIMFPIFDISGRVIAFSGRIFIPQGASLVTKEPPWGEAPKYVNSPETELFKKSETLYGLHLAKSEIRRLDYTVLVEGQIDLVLSHQAGVKNTVASSGTALTESHLKKIQKLSNRCIVACDADTAGKAAARRSGELALSLGMEVKIASLPEGEDPASVIQKSENEWKELLKNSVNLVEFTVDEAVRKHSKQTELIKEFHKSVLLLLSSIQGEMLRSEMVSLASKKTKISEKSIWSDLERLNKSLRSQDAHGSSSLIEPLYFSAEEMLSGIILLTKDDEIKKQMVEILGKDAVKDLFENGRVDKETLLFETEMRFANMNIKNAADELLLRLEKGILDKKLFELSRLLDAATDSEKKETLKKETQKISQRIADLNK